MKVTCYGSRGSIPSPSSEGFNFKTEKYGGDTTCYYLEAGPFRVILDAGSGVRTLGNHLMRDGKFGNFLMLFTHYHWDHIQGMPFCVPFFIGNNTFHIHGFEPDNTKNTSYIANVVLDCLSTQQEKPFFPVPHNSMPAKKHYVGHDQMMSEVFYYSEDYDYLPQEAVSHLEEKDLRDLLKVTTVPLNHPNGCIGYHIEYQGKSVSFCWDNENFMHPNNKIKKICNSTDLLILDGQYTKDQLVNMTQGFGHGGILNTVDEAVACDAKKLVITHHDPMHDDKTMDALYEQVKAKYLEVCREGKGPDTVEFAKQADSWEI